MRYYHEPYVVIGGQYCYNHIANARTLRGAKIIASKHLEYWDNWQGWHYPSIYRAEDVMLTQDCKIVPKPGARPIATRQYGKKWARFF